MVRYRNACQWRISNNDLTSHRYDFFSTAVIYTTPCDICVLSSSSIMLTGQKEVQETDRGSYPALSEAH